MNIPSANNQANERNVRRQNCKDQIARAQDAKKVLMSAEQAHAKFDKLAKAFNAAKKVAHLEGNRYRVFIGTGAKFYPVYLICGSFKCDCRDHAAYGFCSHTKAAAMFASGAHTGEQMRIDAAEEAGDVTLEYFHTSGEIDRFYQDVI